MIRFVCPTCRQQLQAPDASARTKFSCPGCGQRVQVPDPPAQNKTVLGESLDPQSQVPNVELVPVRLPSHSSGMLYYVCPFCAQKNNIRRGSLGTLRKCLQCRQVVDVPEVESQDELNAAMQAHRARIEQDEKALREQNARWVVEQAERQKEDDRRQAEQQRQDERRRVLAAEQNHRTLLMILLAVGLAAVLVILSCCVLPMIVAALTPDHPR